MAWMNDYEYDFVKDSAEKKNIAHSARHKRTHCGKGGNVRFPSDYMTKKELKAMNGEVIKYASLKKPMSFAEFKALPNDLKREYIEYIRARFNAPDTQIATMLGVSAGCLGLYIRDCGASKGMGCAAKKWMKEEFYAWMSGADLDAEEPPVIECLVPVDELVAELPTVVELPVEAEVNSTPPVVIMSDTGGCLAVEKPRSVPKSGSLVFTCPANEALNTLETLLANSHVRLNVSWDVVDTEDE